MSNVIYFLYRPRKTKAGDIYEEMWSYSIGKDFRSDEVTLTFHEWDHLRSEWRITIQPTKISLEGARKHWRDSVDPKNAPFDFETYRKWEGWVL